MGTGVATAATRTAAGAEGGQATGIELGLLREFTVVDKGVPVELPMGAQRVVAFLALADRPVRRTSVAGTLWQDSPARRAGANLRSALWRLNRPGLRLLSSTSTHLSLHGGVRVDLHGVEALAHAVLSGRLRVEQVDRPTLSLSGDFLPDWTDDWVLMERERFRQLRLHALEALCEQLTLSGHYGQAVDAGLAAIAGEPLRESAHRAVIKAYLAEGNRSEALRQYERYRRLADEELRVQPSAGMRALFAAVDGSPPAGVLAAARSARARG